MIANVSAKLEHNINIVNILIQFPVRVYHCLLYFLPFESKLKVIPSTIMSIDINASFCVV